MKVPNLAIIVSACSLAVATAAPSRKPKEKKSAADEAARIIKKYGGGDGMLSKEEFVKSLSERKLHGRPPQSSGESLEEPPPRPEPSEVADHVMENFDGDGDGKLSSAELTRAIENRPPHPPRGGGHGGSPTGE